jgi:hypothetical protein
MDELSSNGIETARAGGRYEPATSLPFCFGFPPGRFLVGMTGEWTVQGETDSLALGSTFPSNSSARARKWATVLLPLLDPSTTPMSASTSAAAAAAPTMGDTAGVQKPAKAKPSSSAPGQTSLPISRVHKIIKADVRLCSKEAIFLISKATVSPVAIRERMRTDEGGWDA